jgi:hypothetical protein
MPQPITLFSGYSVRENRTTNYCLLMLKMLYEENPTLLAQVFSTLFGEEVGSGVGVTFRQQERKQSGVPDGLIVQPPFTIFIETKNFDWFYKEQLENHLADLVKEGPGLKVLLALSNFEQEQTALFANVEALCKGQFRSEVVFKAASFEDLLDAMKIEYLPRNLIDAVSDFRGYLDEEGLLPQWRHYLDVVNCASTIEEVQKHGVYMCPALGGAYAHGRCKYFGAYRDKQVQLVAEIDAVVDILEEGAATLLWVNTTIAKNVLIKRARELHEELRAQEVPRRVFLLSELHDTSFTKDTPGGMYGSKRYFDVGPLGVKNSRELAAALHGRTWSNIQGESAV